MFNLVSKSIRFSSECSLDIKVHACDPKCLIYWLCPHEKLITLRNLCHSCQDIPELEMTNFIYFIQDLENIQCKEEKDVIFNTQTLAD